MKGNDYLIVFGTDYDDYYIEEQVETYSETTSDDFTMKTIKSEFKVKVATYYFFIKFYKYFYSPTQVGLMKLSRSSKEDVKRVYLSLVKELKLSKTKKVTFVNHGR